MTDEASNDPALFPETLDTDGDLLEDYQDVFDPDWTLEEDGLEAIVTDAWPVIEGVGPCAPMGIIAVNALSEVLQLEYTAETEREIRILLETAETILEHTQDQ
jgi:hypothetical protein